MSVRALVMHLVLASAAIAAAFAVSHSGDVKKGGPSSTTLLAARPGEVRQLKYTWPKGSVVVDSAGADKARTAVASVDRELPPKTVVEQKKDDKTNPHATAQKPAAVDAGVDEAVVTLAPPERETSRVPAGKSVFTALAALEPFITKRTLGPADPARLPAMGLEPVARTLVITTAKGELTIDVGDAAYGGNGRYARVHGDAAVHLIDNSIVTALETGVESIIDKRVVTAPNEDVLGYTVKAGAKGVTVIHLDREQTQKQRYATREDPTATDDAAGKLMTTLQALRAQKLVTDAQRAGAAAASFEVQLDGRGPLVVALVERSDGQGYLVRYGEWLAEVSETQAKELLSDVTAVTER